MLVPTPPPHERLAMTASPLASSARTVGEQHLSADLAMDAVTLRVGDLELMSSYYEDALALVPIEERTRAGGEVHRDRKSVV